MIFSFPAKFFQTFCFLVFGLLMILAVSLETILDRANDVQEGRCLRRGTSPVYHVISFGTGAFYQHASLRVDTAVKSTSVKVMPKVYTLADIEEDFKLQHASILEQKRGAGYWIWKPYIIQKHMQEYMDDGDVIIYIDSRYRVLRDITKLLSDDLDYLFLSRKSGENEYKEINWTKYDAYVLMGVKPDDSRIQAWGGFAILRKTTRMVYFVGEWLRYATDPRIVTDQPSQLGQELPQFRENRHDQTVFSLLIVKFNMSMTSLERDTLLNVVTGTT